MIGKTEEKSILPGRVYDRSFFGAKSYAVVAGGDSSCYKKLNAAVHDSMTDRRCLLLLYAV